MIDALARRALRAKDEAILEEDCNAQYVSDEILLSQFSGGLVIVAKSVAHA